MRTFLEASRSSDTLEKVKDLGPLSLFPSWKCLNGVEEYCYPSRAGALQYGTTLSGVMLD